MNWHRSVYSWFKFISFGFGTKLSVFFSNSFCVLVIVLCLQSIMISLAFVSFIVVC